MIVRSGKREAELCGREDGACACTGSAEMASISS